LAQEATAQGFVLLKNDKNILPLNLFSDNGEESTLNAAATKTTTATTTTTSSSKTNTTIALIGPHIFDRHVMLGNYLGETCYDDPTNKCVTSFYEGFQNITHGRTINLLSSKGCTVSGHDDSGFESAIQVASRADTVVFIGGLDLRIESEARDRPDIRLPDIQVRLLQQVSRINPNIVLVLLHGGMVGLDDVIDKVDAIVSLGYPGMYAGSILPKALFGITSHGAWGKTTITWYKNSVVEELNMLDFSMTRPPGRTYRYYTGVPQFRFGYGLNPLTTFDLDDKVTIKPSKCLDGGQELFAGGVVTTVTTELTVTVDVHNVGNRDGDEVVLAYFVPLDVPQTEPASKLRKQLFGFERVAVKAGHTASVTFAVDQKTLQLADNFGTAKTFSGRYIIEMSNGIDWVGQTIEIGSDGMFVGIDCSRRRHEDGLIK
jgi:hypothetical protein